MAFGVIDRDKGYAALKDLFQILGGEPEIMVGVRSEKGGQAVKGTKINLATLAAIHEFGAPSAGIPERSYLRSTVDVHRKDYERLLGAALGGVVDKARGTKVSMAPAVKRALDPIGLRVKSDVQVTITQLRAPPLKAATIKRKGSDNPLIDTGRLRQSIDWEVRLKGKGVT